MRDVLLLDLTKGVQQRTCQNRVVAGVLEVRNPEFLLDDMLFAASDMPLGECQMLELHAEIHAPPFRRRKSAKRPNLRCVRRSDSKRSGN